MDGFGGFQQQVDQGRVQGVLGYEQGRGGQQRDIGLGKIVDDAGRGAREDDLGQRGEFLYQGIGLGKIHQPQIAVQQRLLHLGIWPADEEGRVQLAIFEALICLHCIHFQQRGIAG